MGMEGNFEQPKEVFAPHERAQVIKTPEDIAGQLDASKKRYAQALNNFRAGNMEDFDYLKDMQQNLVAFKYKLDVEFGTFTPETAEISRQVKERLFELSEELEKVTH